MAWAIEWDDGAVRDLRALDPPARERIYAYLRKRVAPSSDPRRLGHPLRGALGELWRYRVGDYRLLCRIEDAACVVLVVAVGHRREVYR